MSRLMKKLKMPAEIKDCLQWPIALASSEGGERMGLPGSDKKQAPEMCLLPGYFTQKALIRPDYLCFFKGLPYQL